MAGSLVKIKGILKELSNAEKRVAGFVVEHSTEISNLAIGELAKRSGSSEATVVRFCRMLGYNGYKDFKIDLTKDMAYIEKNNKIEEASYIEAEDTVESLVKSVSHENKKVIENTLEIISYSEIERAIDALEKARRIEFYGEGSSYIVALDGSQKFCRINKMASAQVDSPMKLISASNLTKEDVAIAISYSGESRDTYEAIRVAKERKATTISITKYGQNSISDLCDIKLSVASTELNVKGQSIYTTIAELNVIDMLFIALASRSPEEIRASLANTEKTIKYKKIR